MTIDEQRIVLAAQARSGAATAMIVYDRAILGELSRTVLRAPGVYDLTLTLGEHEISVVGPPRPPLSSTTVEAPMANGLALRLTISAPGATASDWLLALLPVLMWLAAADGRLPRR